MCNCVDNLAERTKLEIMKRENITEDMIEWSGFANGAFIFNPQSAHVLTNKYEVEYRCKKTDGTPYRNKSTAKMNIAPKYCCYCGEKIFNDEK